MPSVHWPAPRIAVLRLDKEQSSAAEDLIGVRILLEQLPARCDRLVVDMSEADSFGGALFEVLAAAWKDLGCRRDRFALYGLDDFGASLLRICGLDRLWPLYPDLPSVVRELDTFPTWLESGSGGTTGPTTAPEVTCKDPACPA
jgi:anti-anti-sigma regulatory factor